MCFLKLKIAFVGWWVNSTELLSLLT